jgi:hypothetical protein
MNNLDLSTRNGNKPAPKRPVRRVFFAVVKIATLVAALLMIPIILAIGAFLPLSK